MARPGAGPALTLLALTGTGGWAPPAGRNCSILREMDVIHNKDENCYCYVQNRTTCLQYIWSTLWMGLCCLTGPDQELTTNYSLQDYPISEVLDGKLLFLFVAGIFLYHFANSLSRSTEFFYLSGIILGVLALPIFVLLTLRRFIPKHSIFWILMSGCWMSSLYFIYCFKENMHWLWSEHRNYLLGYFLAVGITSFAACYQHGPLTTELSITLFMWTLQLAAFVLIYCGVTMPQVAYAVIAVSLCSKGLCYPLGAACHLGRKMKNHFKSKQLLFKYLTEEEYREQGETETIRALEELRLFCRNPDFPSWLAVSRLQSPDRFADFVLGSAHVSPAETKVHDEEYGIGSIFLEAQLFETRAKPEQDDPANSIHERDKEDEDEIHKQISFPYDTELL